MALAGINLEPLSLPIPFLIAARATSHGVQLVVRYYEELAIVKNGKQAARNALDALFRPGSLAIIVDAVGIAVLVLGAAPFNYKLGLAAGFWGFSVIFTVHFMTVRPQPRHTSSNSVLQMATQGVSGSSAGDGSLIASGRQRRHRACAHRRRSGVCRPTAFRPPSRPRCAASGRPARPA